jgi:RimJ/RimL family protein N-acetyltransferase
MRWVHLWRRDPARSTRPNSFDTSWGSCHLRVVISREPSGLCALDRVRIVQLSPAVLRALAEGDLASANAAAAIPLTPYFAGPEWRGLWRRRSTQVLDDPDSAPWITGVVWDVPRQLAVGRAGFHGPPDPAGMIEVGYAIDPAHRRQGYARAALVTLLDRAAHEPAVRTVRATVSPDNVASRNLILQYGFVEVGEQWDDEDGLEVVYEVSSNAAR